MSATEANSSDKGRDQAAQEGSDAAIEKPGDVAPAGAAGTGENVCPVCGGSGVVHGGACENCAGTGKVTAGIGGG